MTREDLQNIKVPYDELIMLIARDTAHTVIAEHIKTCPIRSVQRQVTALRVRFAMAVAAGATVGGAIGWVGAKLIG